MQKYFKFVNITSLYRVLPHENLKWLAPFRGCVNSAPRKRKIENLNDLFTHVKERPFHLKLLTNIYDSIDFSNISTEDGCLLLNLCGDAVADSPRQIRNETCQKIYNNLVKYKTDLDIFHTYIRICTENSVLLNSKEFLKEIKHSPNHTTYKLLLNNVCEKGDVQQALEILETMRSESLQADEDVFNNLVLAHTIKNGLAGSESVLSTMQTAQMPVTTKTKINIIKGVIQHGDLQDLTRVFQMFAIKLNESQLLKILTTVGLTDRTSWLNKIDCLYSEEIISRDFINCLKKVCIHLVNMKKYDSALAIYQHFVKVDYDENYGFFLLREMIFCQVDTDKIVELALTLQNSNPYIFQKLTEVSLKHKFDDVTWTFLENFTELRPHYFWSLLVNAYAKHEQTGVLDAISRITMLGVKLDFETLENYVFPMCNTSNKKSLELILEKLKTENYTIKEMLSPLVTVLLKRNKTHLAAILCNKYNVPISIAHFLNHLSKSWQVTKDHKSAIILLQKYLESNKINVNVLNDFLCECLKRCEDSADIQEYGKLIDCIKQTGLKLDQVNANNLRDLILIKGEKHADETLTALDGLVDFTLKPETVTATYIPNPKDMTVEDLECHLRELQEKNMNTRGVIRKLIIQHSSLGNHKRVEELKKCLSESDFGESVGMKSSIMHNYIRTKQLEDALDMYREIKLSNPKFLIDSFKIIDLCCLLVMNNRFVEAVDILIKEQNSKKIVNPKENLRNCFELLQTIKDEDQQLKIFNILKDCNYCKPSNVLLGPLVRIHLNNDDIEKAVDVYRKISEDYHCTPLQLELFKKVVKCQDDGLLQKVVDSTVKVHGIVPTQVALIAALAENGMTKALQKFLMDVKKIELKAEMRRRCDRWVKEGKAEALQTLIHCCLRVNRDLFDIEYAAKCVVRIYSMNNYYKDALQFVEFLEQNDFYSEEVKQHVTKLVKENELGVSEKQNF